MKANRELAEKTIPQEFQQNIRQDIQQNIRQVGFENENVTEKAERQISTIILNDQMTRRLAQNTPTTNVPTLATPLPSQPTVSVTSTPLPEQPPKPDPRYQFNQTEITFPNSAF
jgi:hypothetical protein